MANVIEMRIPGISRAYNKIGSHLVNLYPTKDIFDEEWDVLVILDACRFDLMNSVVDEFEYISDIKKSYSRATKTPVWMEETFKKEFQGEIGETAYITGNPNSEKFLTPSSFGMLDEVWRYAWDDELGTIKPDPITDRAITVGRNDDFSRLLVHYMQPHEPFLSAPELGGSDTVERKITGQSSSDFRSVWSRLEGGEISKETVWNHYQENLRRVLESIGTLADNTDAERFVITSDHGNALGEWNIYGHPAYRPIPSLLKVPWIEISTDDSKKYEPSSWTRETTGNVDSRLQDLGYM